MANLLIVLSHPPFSGTTAADAVDFALSATNYGHEVAVLFESDGVFQLQDKQTLPSGFKNIRKKIEVFPLFDIETIYACEESMSNRNVQCDNTEIVFIDGQQKNKVIADSDFVVRL